MACATINTFPAVVHDVCVAQLVQNPGSSFAVWNLAVGHVAATKYLRGQRRMKTYGGEKRKREMKTEYVERKKTRMWKEEETTVCGVMNVS